MKKAFQKILFRVSLRGRLWRPKQSPIENVDCFAYARNDNLAEIFQQTVKKLLYIFLFLTAYHFLFLTTFLFADSGFGRKMIGTSSVPFLKLGVNARAIGMGEAYSAVADGSDAIYWNPAGLAHIKNKSCSFMHAIVLQNTYSDFVSYAQRVGSFGSLGVGFQYLGTDAIDRNNEFGVTVGSFRPYDMAFSLGWAKKFEQAQFGEFLLGGAGKFIQSKIIETAHAAAIDFGVSYNPFDQLWFSASAQNFGSSLKFKEEADKLPFNVKGGSSYRITESWLAALDVNFSRDNNPHVSVGTEYEKWIASEIKLAGRTGFNSRAVPDIDGLSSLSAGIGLAWSPMGTFRRNGKSYQLDFAWVPFGGLGNSYRFSLSCNF